MEQKNKVSIVLPVYNGENYIEETVNSLFNQTFKNIEIICINDGSKDKTLEILNKLAKQINLDLKEYNVKNNKDKYDLNPNFCKCCGNKIEYEKRNNIYCSHSCSATVNNRLRTKEKKCLNCGKDITHKHHNKFCNNTCANEFFYKEKVKRFLNGENFIKCGLQVPNFIKKYLMEIHNNKCEKCGWGERHPITQNIPLEVHHIDGDCSNNRINNLELLCPNCHSLTENFGSLNKNSKRFHRKKNKKILKD